MTVAARQDSAPDLLLPYQQRWVADASGVKVAEKSRRIGLSWASAAEAALLAAQRTGMDVWYVGYNREMAQEFVRDVAFWARVYQLAAEKEREEVIQDNGRDILTFVVHFKSDHRVTALSSRPTNLRGKQGYVIIDEAAFHQDIKGLLKAAMALRMWGGRVAIVSTHDGVGNPFNDLCLSIKAGKKKRFSLHTITIDDALADGLFQRICLRLKAEKSPEAVEWSPEAELKWRQDLFDEYGEDADEELMCIPRDSGGAYLSLGLVEACMHQAPVARLELSDEWALQPLYERTQYIAQWCDEVLRPLLDELDPRLQHAFGQDFGRVSDLSFIAPVATEQNLIRRVPFAVELRNVLISAQKQILFYIVDRLPNFTSGALDATGNGLGLAEAAWERYGAARIELVTLNDPWYAANLPPFKAAFEDRMFSVPRDVDVRDDLRRLEVIGGVPKLPKAKAKGSDGRKRHGDAAIGLVLAHYAAGKGVAPIDFQTLGERESARAWGGSGVTVHEDRGFGSVGSTRDLSGW